jgi:hypothetical protein
MLYIGMVRQSGSGEDRLLRDYWIASLLPIAGLAKVGASQNYWIEFAAITAVLASLALRSRLEASSKPENRTCPATPLLMLGVPVAMMSLILAASAAPSFRELWPDGGRVEEFGRLVERARSTSGEILADPLDVVVLADHRILLEPYIFNILSSQAGWNERPLVERICRGEISLLIVDRPLHSTQPAYHGYTRWPEPIIQILRHTMVLEGQIAGRFLYVPLRDHVRDPEVAC